MELTSEEINALEQSREKETQIRKVLKDLVYNKRIKLNEKKVASVRKDREFSKLDYRYAVSLSRTSMYTERSSTTVRIQIFPAPFS